MGSTGAFKDKLLGRPACGSEYLRMRLESDLWRLSSTWILRHSDILRTMTEELGRLQSVGLQRVGLPDERLSYAVNTHMRGNRHLSDFSDFLPWRIRNLYPCRKKHSCFLGLPTAPQVCWTHGNVALQKKVNIRCPYGTSVAAITCNFWLDLHHNAVRYCDEAPVAPKQCVHVLTPVPVNATVYLWWGFFVVVVSYKSLILKTSWKFIYFYSSIVDLQCMC